MTPETRRPWMARCVALLVTLALWHLGTLASATAQDKRQEAVKTAPEPAPQQPPANNWFGFASPGVGALAQPNSFLPYGPRPAGVCCPGHKSGSCIHRLIEWATYCPKYRVCSCCQCCNSCQYKGVVPLYPFFLHPPCLEGSGLHVTFNNECYRGSKDCTACGHK